MFVAVDHLASPLRATRSHRRMALLVMVMSGFAGLGYQIVWTQQAAQWLGHESAAVLAVVSAFFGGLAVGAMLMGPRLQRAAQPQRGYAWCEVVMAIWALVLALLMQPLSAALLQVIGAQPSPLWQWTVAFAGTFLLLLPATAAMGATLPAMARVVTQWSEADRSTARDAAVASLYGANTLGAVLGVLVAAFWLVPTLGLTGTAICCAALNLACAGLAWMLGPAATAASAPADLGPAAPLASQGPTLALLATTGLLGIGFEVLAVRVLSQVTENTVYTFAMLLAVYLAGTAAGAAAYARGWMGPRDDAAMRDRLLWLLAASCLASGVGLWSAPHIHALALTGLGPGVGNAMAAEALLAVTVFVLPTLLMGALFSHLTTQSFRPDGRQSPSFGPALAANTLGAALAPLLMGVWWLPTWGAKLGLLLLVAGYLALTSRRGWQGPAVWCVALLAAGMGLFAPSLVFVDVPEGGHVVSLREGALGTVSVVEDAQGVRRLRINNRQQEGSNVTQFSDSRQALLPLLLHPQPRQALFLGLGTGTTAAAAAAEAGLQVDAVELLPEVIDASPLFASTPGGESRSAGPHLHLMAADARRYVRASAQRYDVIVSDNFHPARSGSASLYTVEHFQAVRQRLTADGVFCQWLPLHQLDLQTLRSIVRSFQVAFPDGWALLATNSLETPVLGLVARAAAGGFDLDAVRRRLADPRRSQTLAAYGIGDDLALMGSFVAGPQSLSRWAGEAPLNTDDRPLVAYRAPHITYAPDSLPRDRLLELLQPLTVTPAELLGAEVPPAWGQRLAAYGAARNLYLANGRHVRPTSDVQLMLAQVREPLLQVLRVSPDFAPAYEPLLSMANALAQEQPAQAKRLLQALAGTVPARAEAAAALAALPP